MGPKALVEIIADGQADGTFQVIDAGLAAEMLLWLGEGRRMVVIDALAVAERGDVEQATTVLLKRIRAEEATIDRLLGLAAGSIQLAGSEAYLRSVLADWTAAARGTCLITLKSRQGGLRGSPYFSLAPHVTYLPGYM